MADISTNISNLITDLRDFRDKLTTAGIYVSDSAGFEECVDALKFNGGGSDPGPEVTRLTSNVLHSLSYQADLKNSSETVAYGYYRIEESIPAGFPSYIGKKRPDGSTIGNDLFHFVEEVTTEPNAWEYAIPDTLFNLPVHTLFTTHMGEGSRVSLKYQLWDEFGNPVTDNLSVTIGDNDTDSYNGTLIEDITEDNGSRNSCLGFYLRPAQYDSVVGVTRSGYTEEIPLSIGLSSRDKRTIYVEFYGSIAINAIKVPNSVKEVVTFYPNFETLSFERPKYDYDYSSVQRCNKNFDISTYEIAHNSSSTFLTSLWAPPSDSEEPTASMYALIGDQDQYSYSQNYYTDSYIAYRGVN